MGSTTSKLLVDRGKRGTIRQAGLGSEGIGHGPNEWDALRYSAALLDRNMD